MKQEPEGQFASSFMVGEKLEDALGKLKKQNGNDENIEKKLQDIDELWGQLINTLDIIDFFNVLKSLEEGSIIKKVIESGYSDNIQIHSKILCECASSFKEYRSSLNDELRQTQTSKLRSMSDQSGGGFASSMAPVDLRGRTRAFSEPPSELLGSNSQKFNKALGIAEKQILPKISKSENQLNRFSLKRFTEFFHVTVDLFKEIVKQSKDYSPNWFIDDANGSNCLDKARKLTNLLERFTSIFDNIQIGEAESQAIVLLGGVFRNGKAEYKYKHKYIHASHDERLASVEQKEYFKTIFGKEIFGNVVGAILKMIQQGDDESELTVELIDGENDRKKVCLGKTNLQPLIKPLPEIFHSNRGGSSDKTNPSNAVTSVNKLNFAPPSSQGLASVGQDDKKENFYEVEEDNPNEVTGDKKSRKPLPLLPPLLGLFSAGNKSDEQSSQQSPNRDEPPPVPPKHRK